MEFKVVNQYLSETPESLYRGDQQRMAYEALRREVDPETLAMVDRVEDKIFRDVLGLPRKGTE